VHEDGAGAGEKVALSATSERKEIVLCNDLNNCKQIMLEFDILAVIFSTVWLSYNNKRGKELFCYQTNVCEIERKENIMVATASLSIATRRKQQHLMMLPMIKRRRRTTGILFTTVVPAAAAEMGYGRNGGGKKRIIVDESSSKKYHMRLMQGRQMKVRRNKGLAEEG
jgi:hypothetical protein